MQANCINIKHMRVTLGYSWCIPCQTMLDLKTWNVVIADRPGWVLPGFVYWWIGLFWRDTIARFILSYCVL